MVNRIKRIMRLHPALFGLGLAVVFLLAASFVFRIAMRILVLVLFLAAIQWLIDLLHRFRDTRNYRE